MPTAPSYFAFDGRSRSSIAARFRAEFPAMGGARSASCSDAEGCAACDEKRDHQSKPFGELQPLTPSRQVADLPREHGIDFAEAHERLAAGSTTLAKVAR